MKVLLDQSEIETPVVETIPTPPEKRKSLFMSSTMTVVILIIIAAVVGFIAYQKSKEKTV